MRIIVITLLSFFCKELLAQADPIFSTDIESYNFSIEVNETNDSIYGTAIIKGKGTGYGNNLVLNFKNLDKAKKGMTVLKVQNLENKTMPYTHKDDLLRIELPKQNFYTFQIKINYCGIPTNGLVIGKNKFGDKTWFGDNWPNRAQYWLPCVDAPADKATFTWLIKAPEKYTVVANGIKVKGSKQEMNYWKFYEANPIPTKVAVIGIAKLESRELLFRDSIKVTNYYYPQTFAKQSTKMDVANEVLAFFEKTVGPYPYQKLNNVQSTTMFGGMENANNIFYDEYTVDSDESMEALIAHEIAHQWFGNTVTEKDFSHLWLSEGFATFFTNYYLEKKYGVDTMNKRLAEDAAKVKAFLKNNKRPVVDNTSNYMSLLNANSYQKGGLFLQALRLKVGETIFLKIVQTYYAKYKYKNANTDDFRKIVETITKKDFKPFFKEWLYSTTLPKL